jgi:hypothetical protein
LKSQCSSSSLFFDVQNLRKQKILLNEKKKQQQQKNTRNEGNNKISLEPTKSVTFSKNSGTVIIRTTSKLS